MPPRPHLLDVERYYDFIYHWTQLTNRFRAFDAAGAYPIHRGLIDPQSGEFTTDAVHGMIAARVKAGASFRALDAGCGYGGTCIDMHQRIGGTWHGITISRRQMRIAERSIAGLGLVGRVEVRQDSFDHPQPATYDLVYGIESLIHSQQPAVTCRNLVAALVPGGRFIIIDDMPAPGLPASLAQDQRRFKELWRCPVMPSIAQWKCHLEDAGCSIDEVVDLTELMRPRSEVEAQAALADIGRKRRWRDRVGLKMVSDAQEGGLLLERLTREGAVRYAMIVATKRAG